jgi:uncharacterized membrane protein
MDNVEHIHTADCDHGDQDCGGGNISEKERLASLVGGGLLALFGLSRRSWGGLILALFGGALLFRGFTQHCALYSKLGISTAEVDYDAYYDGDNESDS